MEGVGIDNLEDVFNPVIGGFASISATRDHLINNGMTPALADQLVGKYLSKGRREGHVCSLMDLFTSAESKRALNKCKSFEPVLLNFVTLQPNLPVHQVNQRHLATRMQPIRPLGVPSVMARMFSTDYSNDDGEVKKGKFFEFIKKAEKVDEDVLKK